METYTCVGCKAMVTPYSKQNFIERWLIPGEKFCKDCGHTTEDAYPTFCVNGHYMWEWRGFCEKCGGKQAIKVTNIEHGK